jgi:hypothetical protein
VALRECPERQGEQQEGGGEDSHGGFSGRARANIVTLPRRVCFGLLPFLQAAARRLLRGSSFSSASLKYLVPPQFACAVKPFSVIV